MKECYSGKIKDLPTADAGTHMLGGEKRLDGTLDLPEMTARRRAVVGHVDAVGIREHAFRGLDVLREVNNHGTGTARAGNVKRLRHGFGEVFQLLDTPWAV